MVQSCHQHSKFTRQYKFHIIVPYSSITSHQTPNMAAPPPSPSPQATPTTNATQTLGNILISKFLANYRAGKEVFAKRLRPWRELLDSSAFSKPESLREAYTRFKINKDYFALNYFTFVVLFPLLSLLISGPLYLLALIPLLLAWSFYLNLFKPPSDQLQCDQDNIVLVPGDPPTLPHNLLKICLFICTLPLALLYLAGFGWLLIAAFFTAIHAVFRVPPHQSAFLDHQENDVL